MKIPIERDADAEMRTLAVGTTRVGFGHFRPRFGSELRPWRQAVIELYIRCDQPAALRCSRCEIRVDGLFLRFFCRARGVRRL
jgi:hypothetical protein